MTDERSANRLHARLDYSVSTAALCGMRHRSMVAGASHLVHSPSFPPDVTNVNERQRAFGALCAAHLYPKHLTHRPVWEAGTRAVGTK
jgi:hypothetical protein